MRVRDLKFGMVNAWPPSWKTLQGMRFPLDEDGILVGARVRSRDSITIRIVYDDREYDGLVVWGGPPSAFVLADLVNCAAGRPIREVGDLQIPALL
jgi:hypothetical protein